MLSTEKNHLGCFIFFEVNMSARPSCEAAHRLVLTAWETPSLAWFLSLNEILLFPRGLVQKDWSEACCVESCHFCACRVSQPLRLQGHMGSNFPTAAKPDGAGWQQCVISEQTEVRNDGHDLERRVLIAVNQVCVCVYLRVAICGLRGLRWFFTYREETSEDGRPLTQCDPHISVWRTSHECEVEDQHLSAARGWKGQFPTQQPLVQEISQQITIEQTIKQQWFRRQACFQPCGLHQPDSSHISPSIFAITALTFCLFGPGPQRHQAVHNFRGRSSSTVSNSIISGVSRLLAPPPKKVISHQLKGATTESAIRRCRPCLSCLQPRW